MNAKTLTSWCRRLAWASIATALLSGGAAAAAEEESGWRGFEGQGPHEVRVQRAALCCDGEGHRIDIYIPIATAGDGEMPVVTWGNGSWASPEKYDYLLRHLASWGIIVVATRDSSVANGATMLDALETLMAARWELGLKVDSGNVAAVGHSQGAGGAMNALMAADGRIKTGVAISLPSQRFCRGRDCAQIPIEMPAATSVFFVSGERDGLSPAVQDGPTSPPLQSIEAYYDAVPPGRGKFRGAVRGADHNDIQGDPDCGFLAFGCRQGVTGFIGYITAWLRWQLADDPKGRMMFDAEGAHSIFSDPRWTQVEGSIGRHMP